MTAKTCKSQFICLSLLIIAAENETFVQQKCYLTLFTCSFHFITDVSTLFGIIVAHTKFSVILVWRFVLTKYKVNFRSRAIAYKVYAKARVDITSLLMVQRRGHARSIIG